METRFTWDPKKARLNKRDHSIAFEDATQVFADPFHIATDNIHDGSEQRYQAIGLMGSILIVSVVFVDRSEPGVQTYHLISARKADKYEQSAYYDQF